MHTARVFTSLFFNFCEVMTDKDTLNWNMEHWMANVKVSCSTAYNAVQINLHPEIQTQSNLLTYLWPSKKVGRDGTISIGVFQTGVSVVDVFTTDRRRSRGNSNTDSIINRPPSSGGNTPVPERYVLHKILGVQTHHSSWHSCEQEIDVASVSRWHLAP